jgi:hypothetical protein
MIPQADHEDVIWLAGLLEGEGAFDTHRGKYARVRLAMTDRDIVGRAATLFGSSIRLTLRPAPKTSTWHAEVQGPRAEAIMRAVLPYMGARRSSKIAEVLAAVTARRTSSSWAGGASRVALTRPPGLLSPSGAGA